MLPGVLVLDALHFIKHAQGGVTEPALMRCVTPLEGHAFDVFVKFSWQQCSCAALARELVAGMLADHLRIPAGKAALVNVPEAVEDSIRYLQPALAARIRNSVAPAFGSIWLGDRYMLCTEVMGRDARLRDSAAELWAFDHLILNVDRNAKKPNCLTNGSEIAAIDHEKSLDCFGIGGLVPAPWEERWLPYAGHLFHGTVTSGGGSLDRLESAWADIGRTDFIEALIARVPKSWNAGDVCTEIGSYLFNLGVNVDAAFANLRKVLS